jgi:membrane peptidoglycan carboxypeptidase
MPIDASPTMIDSLTSTASPLTSATASPASSTKNTAFDAALQATQKAEQRRQNHADEAIKTGGFTNWVRDTQIEALKEKLRKQVMADMGVDEDSLSRLSAVMREVLEKKIQEEVERRMQEAAAETDKSEAQKGGVDDKTATVAQVGKKDQDGKTCPVIPALSWPGAASLF